MARANTRSIGFDAEQLAAQFLTRHGLTTVTKNFRSRLGEIDMIMLDQNHLVFVEVRFRSSNRFASASQTVDRRKQQKLIRTAALFIAKRARFANNAVRFDVVGIDVDEQGERHIDWIKDAFRPGDSRL